MESHMLQGELFENVILPALTTILFLGLAYLFYPAWIGLFNPSHASSPVGSTLTTIHPINKDEAREQAEEEILLSIIIPAYNEELRLPYMLEAADRYLSSSSSSSQPHHHQTSNPPTTAAGDTTSSALCPALRIMISHLENQSSTSSIEWIVVNDGSQDQTSTVYRSYVQQRYNNNASSKTSNNHQPSMIFRLLELNSNSGKGAAVQAGMLVARGHYRLMVDADGATDFGPGLARLAPFAHAYPLVLGSRSAAVAMADNDSHTMDEGTTTTALSDNDDTAAATAGAQRSLVRQILQVGFHHVMALILMGGGGSSSESSSAVMIQDTQCGFKLFQARHTEALFGKLHVRRWAFDMEVLVRARVLGLAIREVTVPWQEMEGSKLNTGALALARVAVGMLRDVVCLRVCYSLGVWKVPRIEGTSSLPPSKLSEEKKQI